MKKKILVFASILVSALMLCSCDSPDSRQTDVVIDGRMSTSAASEDNEEANETGEETGSMTESSEGGRYQIGETAYIDGRNYEGEDINYSMTVSGTKYVSAQDSGYGKSGIMAMFHIENTGDAKFTLTSIEFAAYADDYEVEMYPKGSVSLSTDLSKGRKADLEYFIAANPDTATSIEVEYDDIIFVLKDGNASYVLGASVDSDVGVSASNDTTTTDNGAVTEEQIFAFTGSWYDAMGNCNMNIRLDDEFYYIINIDWTGTGGAAMNSLYWEFKGDYDASRNVIVYQNGICYSEDAGAGQKTQVYSDGSGVIYMQDGKLLWQDDKEGLAENFVFEKSN